MAYLKRRSRGYGARGVLVLCIMIGLLAAGPAVAQTAAGLDFSPPTGSFTCDQTYTVDVTIDAFATDLRGFSLVMTYDSGMIAPQSVSAGDLLSGAACEHFFTWLDPVEPDSIAVDAASLGCPVSGPGSLVRIVFTGVADGTSPLSFHDVRLRTGRTRRSPTRSASGRSTTTAPSRRR